MDSKTHSKLKKQLAILRKAKDKLRTYGYDAESTNGRFTVQRLQDFCKQLKEDYKRIKPALSKSEAKEIKKAWKKTKKAVEKVTNSAVAVIKIFLRQCGKQNLEDMRQATCEQNFNGWSKRYIQRLNENEQNFFEKTFDRIEKLHEPPYGQPLRPGDHLSIPDEIKSKVMRDWFKKHRTSSRHLQNVDIWNREKRLDRLHVQFFLKLAPSINFTMCGATPISVFEKSYRKKRFEEIRTEAHETYNEAQKMAKQQYESASRVEDALVVYWYQKKNSTYVSPEYCQAVSDTLRGCPPDNFHNMMEEYKEHTQYLYEEADNDNGGYGDGPQELYHWKCWQTLTRNDLMRMITEEKNQGEEMQGYMSG